MINTSPKLNGEPTAQALASGLATLGRYGDSYMVHAAEGETVVPGEILDANPQLKNELFGQMRAMGIEDPNRYVVGNTLNSINPVTGQPEFFFKKIFKAIKKVFKKVAPVALGVVGNIIAPGFGGIIGSALGTKLAGGSWKDALTTGAMAWGAQGLMGGIQGFQGAKAGEGIGGFFSGAGKGLMSPVQAVGGLFGAEGMANPLQQGIFGQGYQGDFFPQYDPKFQMPGAATAALPGGGVVQQASGQQGQMVTLSDGQNVMVPRSWAHQQTFTDAPAYGKSMGHLPPEMSAEAMQQSARFMSPSGQSGIGRTLGEYIDPGSKQRFIQLPNGKWVQAAAKKPDLSFWEKMQTPEFLGPTAAALAPAALTAAFADDKPPSEEELAKLTDPQRSAYQQYIAMTAEQRASAAGQSLRDQWYGPLQYTRQQLASITGVTPGQAGASQARLGGIAPLANQVPGLQLPNLMAAGGGEISGPGTGRSDSIPALLSDGEFVMTAKAVRNAGNGNRDLGAARMYDIMHGFEGRA